jgi:hypothetical protein
MTPFDVQPLREAADDYDRLLERVGDAEVVLLGEQNARLAARAEERAIGVIYRRRSPRRRRGGAAPSGDPQAASGRADALGGQDDRRNGEGAGGLRADAAPLAQPVRGMKAADVKRLKELERASRFE